MNLMLFLALFGSVLSFTASLSYNAVNTDLVEVNHQYDSPLTNIDQYGDFHIRQKRWVPLVVRAVAAIAGKKALNKALKGTKPGKSSISTKQHDRSGTMDDAVKLHKSLGGKPKPFKGPKTEGFTSKIGDRTFTVRDNSSAGKVTLETFKTNTKKSKGRVTDKVRFNGKKDTGSSSSSGGGGGWWGRRKRAAVANRL